MTKNTVLKRRNSTDIIADMLEAAREGALKTQLVYQCNLNFGIIKKYLSYLLENGLLFFDSPRYFATDKAQLYLTRYEALKNL